MTGSIYTADELDAAAAAPPSSALAALPSPALAMTVATSHCSRHDTQLRTQQQQHWQQQVPSTSNSTSLLSRASKIGSDTYSAARRFTGDHVHIPRIPYLSSSVASPASSSKLSRPPTTSTSCTAGGVNSDSPPAEEGSSSLLDPEPSLRPYDHREKTALHALRDTFVLPTFPSPASLLPNHVPLPSIPCMGGLSQSSLFVDPLLAADEADKETEAGQARSAVQGVGKDPFRRLSGNVLMMGGYRGSMCAGTHSVYVQLKIDWPTGILRDAATGRRLWVPLRVGFNVRKADLAIGLTVEDEIRSGCCSTSRNLIVHMAYPSTLFDSSRNRSSRQESRCDRRICGPRQAAERSSKVSPPRGAAVLPRLGLRLAPLPASGLSRTRCVP